MVQQVTYYPLLGGLDETTPAISVARGKCIGVMNHEALTNGYGRIGGYERFSGQLSPTAAFDAEDGPEDGAIARENARTAIAKVPGTGPVRGNHWFDDKLYAWRDNVAQTACVMYVSSSTGWVGVDLGYVVDFNSGGTYEIQPGDTIVGATSARTAVVRKVITTTGSWTAGTAVGYMVLDVPAAPLTTENINVLANSNVATLTTTMAEQGFPPGGRYEFETHNFYATSSLRCFYGINQVGQGFEVDIGGHVTFIRTGNTVDIPIAIAVYRNHLFFGFEQGSVQHSAVGTPTLWDGVMGAAEIGLGSPVTGFCTTPGSALFIFSETKVSSLYGSGAEDWQLEDYTDEGGGFRYTMQRANQMLYMDNTGIRTVATAREFGNFKMATLSAAIENTLNAKHMAGVLPVSSCIVKEKTQYRLFFDDGTGISIFFGHKNPECMLFYYPDVVATCITTTKEELGGERVFFGGDTGYVYELDVGTSFDGEIIEAYLQLPFDHEGGPLILKKWHKLTLEMVATPETEIAISAEFDYSGTDQPGLGLTNLPVLSGSGGIWSIHNWDEFYWSSPIAGIAENWIDGQGLNMSIIIVSTSADQMPYIIQGVSKSFTTRGQKR